MSNRRILVGAGLLLLVVAAMSSNPATQGLNSSTADRVLEGAIDIHAHADPDSLTAGGGIQRVDALDLVRLAKASGMRGFVYKQHFAPTAVVAALLRKEVPGIEVFGVVALNRAMGGINLAAVQHMTEVKGGWGRVVFMPTLDSEYTVRRSREPNRPVVAVSKNGELLPEVKAVIAFMAATKTRDSNGSLVLATGHSSPEESLMLVREARRQGVQVIITHPLQSMTIPQMQEAAKLGAYVEVTATFALGADRDKRIPATATAIKQIGANACIVSSDLGRAAFPAHPDGLTMAAKALRDNGFTEPELDRMFKENPARLLGLTP